MIWSWWTWHWWRCSNRIYCYYQRWIAYDSISHQNHGMYFTENSVRLSGVKPDVKPTNALCSISSRLYIRSITVGLVQQHCSHLKVLESAQLTQVYCLLEMKVITYTNVTGNTIGGNIVRGRNPKTYPAGTPVFKYELSGVSLGRINQDTFFSRCNRTLTPLHSIHIKLNST